MIDDEEKGLVAAGVREAIQTLYSSLHSEDDHGYDLYKWLEGRQDKIIQAACEKVAVGRAMLVD
jgi:hypothetical protein